MKKPLSRKAKAALLAAGLILLIGVCCLCVTLYAKSVINAPKFEKPEEAPLPSVTEIPASEAEKLAYLEKLYTESFCKGAQVSYHTDISVDDGSITVDCNDADLGVLKYAKGSVLSHLSGKYDSCDKMSGNMMKITPAVALTTEKIVPGFALTPENIITLTLEQGKTGDDGEVTEDEFYFFSGEAVTSDPLPANYAAFSAEKDTAAAKALLEDIADSCAVSEINTEITSCSFEGKIDRVYDHLIYIHFTRVYTVSAVLDFTGDYASMGKVKISFEYKASDCYDYNWFGARFTEKAVYLNPGDFEALPASVVVDENAASEDYELTFDVSDESIVTVDEGGVITAIKASETPVKVKMTLKYLGMEFSDECSVTVTEMEVE